MKIIGILLLGVVAMADLDPVKRYSWGPQSNFKPGFRGAPWIRDPFFPSEKKLLLKGIISGELAFINNRWVREGDKVDGYTVVKVEEREVALRKASEELVLKMNKE